MASIAFARKYRPRVISDYMGESIRNILNNRFSSEDRYPQSILLHGTMGCGKTTAARLIAKEYLCLDKVNGHACGVCAMCDELDNKLINSEAGVSVMGVQEVDIASDSGKAAMDQLLEEALLEPMPPLKYKILILDECHMASNASQNRLLKILEEPPKHLIFIFCTTDPDKMLPTIRSRCQLKIEVKKPSIDELTDRLLEVSKSENLVTSKEALKIIVKKADRVPREALNLLEAVATEYGNNVSIDNVSKYTGAVSSDLYMDFYKVSNKSLESILIFVNQLKSDGMSIKDFIRGLTRFTLDSISLRYGIGIDNFPVEYVKQVKSFLKGYNTEELDCLIQVIEYANKNVDSDETKAELILVTTGMRISKLKLLSIGLNKENEVAAKENKKSMDKNLEILKEEKSNKPKKSEIAPDNILIKTVFGKEAENLKFSVPIENKNEVSTDEEIGTGYSDDTLMKLFTK